MAKHHPGKRIFALALAGALLTAPAAAFSDTDGHWAQQAVSKWSEEYGIIRGYEDGTFRPDNTITRGAFAGILDRFLQYQAVSPADTFSDTAGTYWENAILKLHAAGVYLGTDGQARTTAEITRQQALTMVARAFDLPETDQESPWVDGDQIAGYAAGYLRTMAERGYITDSGEGYFRPTDAITRAEFVNLLNNMVDVLVQESGAYSQNAAGTLMVNAAGGAELHDMAIGGDLIVAPGVSGTVTLRNVTLGGEVRNLGSAEVKTENTPPAGSGDTVTVPGDNTSGGSTGVPDSSTDVPGSDTVDMPEPPPATLGGGMNDPGFDTVDPDRVPSAPAENIPPLDWNYITLPDGKKIPNYEGVEVSPLQYNGSFVWDESTGRLNYSGGQYATRFGIDVSAFQNRATEGNVLDWDAVRNCGVQFAFVRIGYRGTSSGSLNPDAFYKQNLDGAMAAGIETGAYFFSQAITVAEAVEEANYVLSLLDGRRLTGPIAYDWEMHDSTYRVYGTPPEVATACAKAFCETIENAGYRAMVYTSNYVAYNKFDLSVLSDYLLWYPEYKKEDSEKLYPQLYYMMDYWQYTSAGSIDGITGNVDCSIQFLRR